MAQLAAGKFAPPAAADWGKQLTEREIAVAQAAAAGAHNKEIAEDLMQQTFLKAFQHLQEFEVRDASYLTYLLKIAHNTLVNYYRVPKPIPLSLLHEIPGESSFRIHKRHDATLLWRAVRQRPEAEKNALLLKYQKELSIIERFFIG